MTTDQIEYLASLREAGGHTTMPVPLAEWKEYMATKSIGKVDAAALAKGKIKPKLAAMPVNRKIGAKAKADRKEAGFRANAAKRKGAA